MHVALSAKKFRAFSDSHEDDRCMTADAVQDELLKAGPLPVGKAGVSAIPGKLAAGPGLKAGGGMLPASGKIVPLWWRGGGMKMGRESWSQDGSLSGLLIHTLKRGQLTCTTIRIR